MRRPLLAGNWKLYKNAAETAAFFREFLPLVAGVKDRDILVCPPFTSIATAAAAVKGTPVRAGAQNVHCEKNGAFTGEVSVDMVKEAGAAFVLLGHSERRHVFGERDELIHKKVRAVLDGWLTPVLCVGELLSEREAGKTDSVVASQLEGGLRDLAQEAVARIVIAYEPVWAIGTGKTATPEDADAVHAFIRKGIAAQYSKKLADDMRILYGGSVKPDNIDGLMAKENIDGALVGGASLKPADFARIVKYEEKR